jgi:hypothetical protein
MRGHARRVNPDPTTAFAETEPDNQQRSTQVRKHLLVALALVTFAGFVPQAAPAQLPGGIRIPRPSRPKATPASTPAGAAQPAPAEEATPAAQPQPRATAATNSAAPAPQAPAGGPMIIKTRVQFWPYTLKSYQGKYNDVWSWIPWVKFVAEGQLPAGAHYYAEVAQPGGGAWLKIRCSNNGENYDCLDRDGLEAQSTLATGVFPFAIKIRNPLEGTDVTVFTGRAKVEKALTGGNIPPTSKMFVYYANHDANLPIGQIYFNERYNSLGLMFWVRGDSPGLVPYLFYKGQEVTMNWAGEVRSGGSCSGDLQFEPAESVSSTLPQGAKWNRVDCYLAGASFKPSAVNPGAHAITANPGEYEVRVLRKGKLARTIKFTVGPDGQLVNNGLGAGLGMPWVNFVPVAVHGDQDGPWDKNAWKTEANYGNPLSGFSWPPQ